MSPGRGLRWLALRLPELPIERRLLAIPDRDHPLVAVVASEGSRDVVRACSRAAKRAGIRQGQPAVAARALAAGLVLLDDEPDEDHARLESLGRVLFRFTPDVVVEAPETILLETGRTAHLFGGEAALVELVLRELSALGHGVCLGLADTPAAARALARAGERRLGGHAVHRAPPGDPTAWLRPLPWPLLGPPPALAALARDLGLRTAGELFDLPREGLATRADPESLLALDHLRGTVDEPLRRLRPREDFHESLELWQATDAADRLLFAAKRLFDLAEADLVRRGHGVAAVEIALRRFDGGEALRLTVRPVVPTASAHRLARLFQHRLESLALPSPVTGIALRYAATVPLVETQRTLFEDARPEDLFENDVLLDFLGRLAARLGDDRVHGASLVDDHRPERAFRWRPIAQVDADAAAVVPSAGRRPLEVHPEPEALRVAEDDDRRPTAILDEFAKVPLQVLRGPERLESGWFDGHDVRRSYFEVETPRGERLWLFCDADDGQWRCHGIFT